VKAGGGAVDLMSIWCFWSRAMMLCLSSRYKCAEIHETEFSPKQNVDEAEGCSIAGALCIRNIKSNITSCALRSRFIVTDSSMSLCEYDSH
jgi:hypothetical protein